MPQTLSAKRSLRVQKRRTAVNLLVKNQVKTALKKTRKEPTGENLQKTFSLFDQAVKKKVFSENKVSRLKRRLNSLLTNQGKTSYTKLSTHAQKQHQPAAAGRLRKKTTR